MTQDIRQELPSLPPTWDPEPIEKQYYRNRMDGGQFGWMVRRNGKNCIQLNRPGTEPLPYRPLDWIPEREPAPLNKSQASRIAFEAHKALCHALGEYRIADRNWLNMTDAARIAWMKHGPEKMDSPHREVCVRVYGAIMAILEPLTK